MKGKELTETYIRFQIENNPLVPMVYVKVFQRCKGSVLFFTENVEPNEQDIICTMYMLISAQISSDYLGMFV